MVTVATASLSIYLFSGTLPVYLHRDHGYSLSAVGALVGVAFVIELFATLLVGPLIDRRGARLALRTGPVLYLLAALLFLSTPAALAVGLARVLQGIGLAMILPAAYAVIPELVPPQYRGTALGGFGIFQNLALAVGPPLGLWLLSHGAPVLFAVATGAALLGLLLSLGIQVGRRPEQTGPLFTYRGSWTPLYAFTFFTVVYWGVVTAYLPLHVPRPLLPAVGWFFTADALGVLAFRVPAGYLSDRFGSRWLFSGGIGLTVGAIVLLLTPPSVVALVCAGVGTGAGAALLIPPTLVELQKRSDQRDRGTAMALWTTSFAGAIGVGSIAAAPVVQNLGFNVAMTISAVCCLLGTPVALGLRAHADR
jgi:MFS family permease